MFSADVLDNISAPLGHISGRPGVPPKGHLARSRTKWCGSEKWELREEIKKLSAALRAPWQPSSPPPMNYHEKASVGGADNLAKHSYCSPPFKCCCCYWCCRWWNFPFSKLQNFPSRSSVLCPEEEANSNSYTHRFSIKQRVVETKRITIVGQKNTGGLS